MIKNYQKKIHKYFLPILMVLFMLSIIGVIISGLNAYASGTVVTEVKIDIDFAPYEEQFPDGVVGRKYNVFPATASDNLGNDISVDVIVTDPNGKVVLVSNGSFITEVVGDYIITYKASSGVKEDVEKVAITVNESCDDLIYIINENNNSEGVTGEIVYLYNGDATGGSGNINVDIIVSVNDEPVEIYKSANFQYFVPVVAGEYLVSYALSDFVGNTANIEQIVTIIDSELPIIKNPSISLINSLGSTIKLPLVDAILYKDGNSYFVPIKVEYDGQDITDAMSYHVDTVGKHTIKYSAENVFTGAIAEKTYEVCAVDLSTADSYISNFFALNNFVGSFPEESDGYFLTAENDGDASLQFTSKIHTEFININFGLQGKNEVVPFKSFDFILTDSERGDDKVTIRFTESDGQTKLYNNGCLCYQSETTLTEMLESAPFIKFNKKTNQILDNLDHVLLNVKYFDDGRAFTGFQSDYVYISMEYDEIVKGTTISVKSISTDPITNEKYDLGKPKFYGTQSFSQSVNADIGEVITLTCPKAFDLLDNDSVTYSAKIIYNETKEVLYQGSIQEPYDLLIENSGDYKVEFYATDSSGLRNRLIMTIHVADRISPNVEVDFKIDKVKVGDEVTIPTATFSDNISSVENCMSFIYVEHGTFLKDLVVDTYKFTKAGEYVFTYSVWDEAGNCTTIKYVVVCE